MPPLSTDLPPARHRRGAGLLVPAALGGGLALMILLGAAPALPATGEGDAVIARARAAEAAQLDALAGMSVSLRTQGWVDDGSVRRAIESFRRLDYRGRGKVVNVFQRATLDGKSITEVELRRAIGAAAHPPERQREVLGDALAPLNSPDVDVEAVGPTPAGGYALRCRVRAGALVSVIHLIVDAASGRKRTATLQMAGLRARLADRLENVLTYGDDGAPRAFHANFHVKLAWIERSAEFRTQRLASQR